MTTRTLTAAATLVTAAGLLLAGCGSSSDQSSGPIKGAQTAVASAVPSASTPSEASGPTIMLPKDVNDTFDGWTSADPVQQAILHDSAQSIKAVDSAIVQGKASTSAMTYYLVDNAYRSSVRWVQSFISANLSITGTIRYYSPRISNVTNSSASLIYCGDETQASNKDRKTGKVSNGVTSAKDAYVIYNTGLTKNEAGVWQTSAIVSQRGAQQCQS